VITQEFYACIIFIFYHSFPLDEYTAICHLCICSKTDERLALVSSLGLLHSGDRNTLVHVILWGVYPGVELQRLGASVCPNLVDVANVPRLLHHFLPQQYLPSDARSPRPQHLTLEVLAF
jgi:hypothetical protein